jgi:Dyp-type peroxidase family
MITTNVSVPIREAPASSPSPRGMVDPAHPEVSQGKFPEPRLKVDQIQGNILPGFLKDFETLLFLKIDHVADCKQWLRELVPLIATADEVLTFNRLFKAIRHRRGRDSNSVKATWVNIAFSYSALKELTKGTPADVATTVFTDASFKNGLAAQSPSLGDPTDPQAESNPNKWVVGGPSNEADIVLIVQSDDRDDLFDQVEQLEDSIYAFRRPDGSPAASGVHVTFKQHGANLPGSLAGHEQFGFLDGVSQPGIRGYVSDDGTNVLTPRQNPRDENQGKPGQDLLWPGEFVFGYQGQNAEKPVEEPGDPVHAGPTWADNGSFLVFRRLRQDVAGFHTFLQEQGQKFGRDPKFVGAKIVGRWPSGAPILRASKGDNAPLGNDDCANNDFDFFKQDPSLDKPQPGPPPPDSVGSDDRCSQPKLFAASPGDQKEMICPAFGHIRKTYPRDDITPAAPGDSVKSEQATQTHRLLRRGIPYGPASLSTPDAPFLDEVDRGLLFAAYMTSITNQFEFVTRVWVNNSNFKEGGVGFDLVIGQNPNPAANRVRTAKLILDDPNHPETLTAPKDWVIPTGGGYFFAPSISALENELSN